jgi:uncharacterized protein (DUF2141 family)
MLIKAARHAGVLLLLLWFSACASSPPLNPIPIGEGRLDLEIKGFRNDRGEAIIYLYPDSRGFPEEIAPKMLRRRQAIHNRQTQLEITNLPYHNYAIAVLHDENRNGRMDKSLLGFPLEGCGFSRNPAPRFGPPDYQKARFLFAAPVQRQIINIQYPARGRKPPQPKAAPG